MMKSTRRTFFAAIGAAVLGKYAVKFWPEMTAANRQAVLDYITACREQAARTFAAYIDADDADSVEPTLGKNATYR